MKRALFTMTVLMASAMSFAQAQTSAPMVGLERVKAPMPVNKVFQAATKADMPKKSIYNGNYYTVPSGALYMGYNLDDMGYQATFVNIPGLMSGTFTNMNENPFSASWTWNGNNANELGLVDENNNFVWIGMPSNGADGIRYVPAPVLNGADSYTLPSSYNQNGIISVDRLSALTYADPHIGRQIYGTSGFMSTQYLWGTGDASVFDIIDNEDGTKDTVDVVTKSFGFAQHYTKPMSPLYIENIYIPGISAKNNQNPLGDKALTMQIVGDSGNMIAELTVKQEDLINRNNTDYLEPFGTPSLWTIKFENVIDDPVWGELVEPIIINEGFTIMVTGFDQEGVDLGLFGFQADGTEVTAPLDVESGVMLTKREDGTTKEVMYAGVLSIPITFTALTDNVFVQTDLTYTDQATGDIQEFPNSNVLRISENGADSYLESGADVSLYVSTATPWEDGGYIIEMVETNDDSEWLNLTPTNNTEYWEQSGSGFNLLNFTANPINAGEGRWAVLKVSGRGVESESPIIILQGNATLDDVPTGIENVVNDNNVKADPNAPVYNISGQRVSKDAKGILIQNGKKFMNK